MTRKRCFSVVKVVQTPSVSTRISEEDKIMRVLLRSKGGGEHSVYNFELAERAHLHISQIAHTMKSLLAQHKVIHTVKECPFNRTGERRPSWRAV